MGGHRQSFNTCLRPCPLSPLLPQWGPGEARIYSRVAHPWALGLLLPYLVTTLVVGSVISPIL